MVEREVATAIHLMKMAIALLDKAGAGHTNVACHLQMAIDFSASLEINDAEKIARRDR